MNWIILLLGLIAFFIAIKLIHFKHIKHKIVALFIILLVLFFALSFSDVVKNNNIDLKSPSGVISAGKVYVSWLGTIAGNVGVLTGNAVRMSWAPKNLTG